MARGLLRAEGSTGFESPKLRCYNPATNRRVQLIRFELT